MNFLEFYEVKKNEFKHLELDFLGSLLKNDPSIKKQLEQAKNFPALKKLCADQDEIMFMVLQSCIILPHLKWADKYSTKRYRKLKNEPKKIEDYINKLSRDCADAISKAKKIDSAIDENQFWDIVKKWINYKINIKLSHLDKYDDAIEFVCIIDRRLDASKLRTKLKTSMSIDENLKGKILKHFGINDTAKNSSENLFNNILLQIYNICREKTNNTDNFIRDRMAEVLNSLNIATKTGKPFTNKGLSSIFKNLA